MLKLTLLLFFLLLLTPFSSRADSSNYQNYVVGERAAGMGGAYTAFSESAEGSLYNPGGLVFSPDNRISLSANVIRYTTGTIENGLVISATNTKDVKISDLKVTPASSVGMRKFNLKWDKKNNPEGIKKNVWALSFYKPDDTNYTGQEELDTGGIESLFNYRVDDSLLLSGLTYSRLINNRLGIGGTLFYGYRKTVLEQFIMANIDGTFGHRFSLIDFNYGGLLGILGAKWNVSPRISLGLSVRTPAIRLHGKGTITTTLATLNDAGETSSTKTVLDDLTINMPLPVKITGGVGYRGNHRFSLALDGSLYLPNSYTEAHDPQGRRGNSVVGQNLVVNVNAGGEYRLGADYPLRAGFFTNFSSADDVEVGGNTRSKVDYYGGTLSVAREKEKYATQLGMQLSYGAGNILVGDSINDVSLLNITAMVASSFRF